MTTEKDFSLVCSTEKKIKCSECNKRNWCDLYPHESKIAKVVPQTLSDGSEVFNVMLEDGDERVKIATQGKYEAREIADTINRYANHFEVVGT